MTLETSTQRLECSTQVTSSPKEPSTNIRNVVSIASSGHDDVYKANSGHIPHPRDSISSRIWKIILGGNLLMALIGGAYPFYLVRQKILTDFCI